jgi:hypothetical protein
MHFQFVDLVGLFPLFSKEDQLVRSFHRDPAVASHLQGLLVLRDPRFLKALQFIGLAAASRNHQLRANEKTLESMGHVTGWACEIKKRL